jgi:ADP-heptose:LPS heptosyltransferase
LFSFFLYLFPYFFLAMADSLLRRSIFYMLKMMFGIRTVPIPLPVSAMRKILIFRYDRIGDMVLTTPVFALLREHLPQAEIHVLASPANAPLLRHDERVSRIHTWDKSQPRSHWLADLWKLRQQMLAEDYDAVLCLVFNKTWDGVLAQILCGSRAARVTIAHRSRIEFYTPLYDIQVPRSDDSDGWTIARLQAHVTTQAFGLPTVNAETPLHYHIALPPELESRMEYRFQKPILLFNISAGEPERCWTLEASVEALCRIHERHPELSVQIICSPQDAPRAAAIQSQCAFVECLPATPDILEVCAAVKRARYVITPDTSIVHIASVFGVPLVGLYAGVSREALFLPFSAKHVVVSTADGEALAALAAEEVVAAFARLLTLEAAGA